MSETIWTALGGDTDRLQHLGFRGEGSLPSARPPLRLAGSPMYWELPATELGSSPAQW